MKGASMTQPTITLELDIRDIEAIGDGRPTIKLLDYNVKDRVIYVVTNRFDDRSSVTTIPVNRDIYITTKDPDAPRLLTKQEFNILNTALTQLESINVTRLSGVDAIVIGQIERMLRQLIDEPR